MAEPAKNLGTLEAELADFAAELYERFTPLANQSGSEILHLYMDRIERLAAAAIDSGLSGLCALCARYQQSLHDLARSGYELSAAQREQLEQLPMLTMAYIAAPENAANIEALLTHLQNTFGGEPLPQEEIHALRGACVDSREHGASVHSYISDHDVEIAPHDGNIASDVNLLASLQQEALDAISVLFNELDTPQPTEEEQTSNTVEAIFLCADRINLLGMSAATAGLFGLTDVCQLFQHGLFQLANQNRDITPEERDTIEHWRGLVVAYLDNPSDIDAIISLADFFIQVPWMSEVSENDTLLLKEMLLPEQILLEQSNVTGTESSGQNDTDTEASADDPADDVSGAEIVPGATPVLPQTGEPEISPASAFVQEPDSPANQASGTNEPISFSRQQLELINLIQSEIQASEHSLSEKLGLINSGAADEPRLAELRQYCDTIQRFGLAAESVGLLGLHQVLAQLQRNTQYFQENLTSFTAKAAGLLERWPAIAVAYLDHIQDAAACRQLSNYLIDESWPIPLDLAAAEILAHVLSRPQFPDLDEGAEARPTQACAEDVSLALPQDVNRQLLESLLQELPQHTAEFSQAIANIMEHKANLNDVDVAKRIAHTLKGSANTVGVAGIAKLAHHIEDILVAFTKHQKLPGPRLADVLMNASDVLEMMTEALVGNGPAPQQSQSLAVLQMILDWANRIDKHGIPEDDQADEALTTPSSEAPTDNPEPPVQEQESMVSAMLRVPAGLVDDLMRLVGESVILTGQLKEQLAQAQHEIQSVREQNALFQQLAFELEQLVDVQGIASALEQSELQEQFDSLELDQYNELHTITRRLVEAATDAKEITQGVEDHLTSVENLLGDQGRLQKQNQEVVMQTRMVPVKNIVPRLQRSVRQTCRLTGKKVELDVNGIDTLIDSDVLNELVDPLMHVLRNAIDHGIEPAPERETKGKAQAGNIQLSFYREGDHIVVRCVDDGAGLDYDKIKSTALKKKLIEPGRELSQEELARLILLPGFTTRQETTQVSGRGIGMDAVYTRVLKLKGGLSVESQPGAGCRVEFRLPITLVSIHALMVRVKDQTLAVSTRNVEQIMYVEAGALQRDNLYEDQYTFALGDEILPVDHLETLLDMPIETQSWHRSNQPILIVRDDSGNKRAILVEQVRANQDLVVKQLGVYAPRIEGIEGATILGDGSVAAVIDLPGLMRAQSEYTAESASDHTTLQGVPAAHKVCALVVDDSLSARRSLAEFLRDTGYDVLTARDGLDAIEVMAKREPDILLVDLEMPRMNGLELTSHVRAKYTGKHFPIVMITSRSTEKHRQQALRLGVDVYLTKPYIEDDLLRHIEAQLDRNEEKPLRGMTAGQS